MNIDKTALIRALNDGLRQNHVGGRIVATPGVMAEGPDFLVTALAAIAQFDRFESGNDPYDEHDFGAIVVSDQKMFWKIDYYDLTLTAGADDPSDPGQTTRVLTIMLAEEY